MDRKTYEECGRAFAAGVAAALADHEKKRRKTPELIDRKELLYRMDDFAAFAATYKPYMSKDDIAESVLKQAKEQALRLVEEAPTIEAAPVVHGRWIDAEQYVDEDGLRHTQVRCSLCGRYEDEREPYCNCGADMRKEKEVMPAKFNEDGCPFDCPCLDDYPDCYCNAKMDGKAV